MVGLSASVGVLELRGWGVAEVAVESLGVVPVDPAQGGEFDVVDAAPWAPGGAADQFGLVEADDGFGEGVDAPICQECCSWAPVGGAWSRFGVGFAGWLAGFAGWLAGFVGSVGAGAVVGHDALVDLACEESFEAADDVFLGEAFGGAAGGVVDGGLVEAHAHDGGPVERGVGLSVSAAVQAVPAAGHSRAGGDRAGAAELRERGLGLDPVWVVAEHDQQLSGGVGADAVALAQCWRRLGCERVQQRVMGPDLLIEVEPSPRQALQRLLGRGGRVVDGAGTECGQRSMSALSGNPSRDSRSSAGALTIKALSAMIAEVRPLRAVSRATLVWRIISTRPSADFGIVVAVPARTARAAASASAVSDLPLARRLRRSPRLTSTTR